MLLRMVGEYLARKGIPADVRDDYARLYGVRWESQAGHPERHTAGNGEGHASRMDG